MFSVRRKLSVAGQTDRSLLEEMCAMGWPWRPVRALVVRTERCGPEQAVAELRPNTWVHVGVCSPPMAVTASSKVVRACSPDQVPGRSGHDCILCVQAPARG